MNDTEICFFVMRLSYSQVKPAELATLSEDDFKKVMDYVERRKGLYLHRYISTLFASRTKLAKEVCTQIRVFSESEILTGLGVSP